MKVIDREWKLEKESGSYRQRVEIRERKWKLETDNRSERL